MEKWDEKEAFCHSKVFYERSLQPNRQDKAYRSKFHAHHALAPAALRSIGRGRRALEVAGVGDGHHHVLFLDEIFDVDLGLGGDDLGAALVAEAELDVLELAHDHAHEQLGRGEDGAEALDLGGEGAVLAGELLAFEAGEAGEAHLEDGLGLALGEVVVGLPVGLGALGQLVVRYLALSGARFKLGTHQYLQRLGNLVQDPSAAMVVRLANPQKGQRIYDLCAAPGGKSTFAAELTNDEATIIALDKYAGKLKVIQENTERLRLTSITAQAQDARTFAPKEKADIVLLDAPCSGLGTLAKKPDIKWKFEITDFAPILRTQRELLTNAAKLVKVGGALVYSTCTIEPEENTEQIAWFLKEFPNYELDRAENYLPEALCKDGFMQMFPHSHQTDGAFAARLVRKS